MTTDRFWKGLAGLVVLTLGLLWGIDLIAPATKALGFLSLVTVAVFTLILIGAFYLGHLAVRSASKSRFIQLVMMIMIVKMLVCVLIIAVYLKVQMPENKLFVIPFLAIYLIFTIFEVIVLERIARMKVRNGAD